MPLRLTKTKKCQSECRSQPGQNTLLAAADFHIGDGLLSGTQVLMPNFKIFRLRYASCRLQILILAGTEKRKAESLRASQGIIWETAAF